MCRQWLTGIVTYMSCARHIYRYTINLTDVYVALPLKGLKRLVSNSHPAFLFLAVPFTPFSFLSSSFRPSRSISSYPIPFPPVSFLFPTLLPFSILSSLFFHPFPRLPFSSHPLSSPTRFLPFLFHFFPLPLPSRLHYCRVQRRRSPEANQTLHDVWPSPGLIHYYIHFRGLLPPGAILSDAKFTLRPSLAFSYVALLHGTPAAGVRLRRGTRNGITELSQRAPPIFGWAAITLGIDPHSSGF